MDFNYKTMKKLFLSTLLTLSINCLFAQGNLQFNKVISTTVSVTAGSSPELNGTLVGSITVPAGKVLKLESVSTYLNNSTGDIQWYYTQTGNIGSRGCWIGGHLVWAPFWYTTTGSTNIEKSVETSKFPIWYGEGTYEIRVRYKTNFGAGTFYVVSYSAIEFNII